MPLARNWRPRDSQTRDKFCHRVPASFTLSLLPSFNSYIVASLCRRPVLCTYNLLQHGERILFHGGLSLQADVAHERGARRDERASIICWSHAPEIPLLACKVCLEGWTTAGSLERVGSARDELTKVSSPQKTFVVAIATRRSA